MSVKFMAITGSRDPVEEQQLGGKCLGVSYDIREDQIFFQVHPCFYPSKAKSSDMPRDLIMLTQEQVEQLWAGTLGFTRRQALSMVMGLYDPLSLVSPALVHGKLLLRQLYSPQVATSWDQDLPTSEKELWAGWFKLLLEPVEARFPRTIHPTSAVGLP